MSGEEHLSRLPLLKTIKDFAKSGATLDASIVTTYAFNGLFYEEVLLRAFERAGSRLNIVLADAGQLTESLVDPLRRPSRAGVDYLLVPISHVGAFHPKLIALLSERQPILAIGSHNVTDAGFSHNEEVTAFWGKAHAVPPGVLRAVVDYALHWLEASSSIPVSVLAEIIGRLRSLLPPQLPSVNSDTTLIASSGEEPLWGQLKAKVFGPVKRVTVVGPYFDAGMDLFKAIERDLAPSEIIVAIQPANVVLPYPGRASKATRFVDASRLRVFWPKADEVGFAHGKAMAIEAERGLVVTLGSANPTGAAWLAGPRWNAEANLCLTGATAAAAFSALGLDRLADAPSLQQFELAELAERSLELRSQERAPHDTPGPPVVSGQVVDGEIFLVNFHSPEQDHLVWVDAGGAYVSATLKTIEGGSVVALGDHRIHGGLYELRSNSTTIVFVLLNDAPALRAATMPRDGARILDYLGSLESGTGFTDLLDLLDKHILAPSDGIAGPSRAANFGGQTENIAAKEAPFGPRGVSLPFEEHLGSQRRRLNDGLIADIIAALIRALGAPEPTSATDGDAPDLDEADAGDVPSSDDLARNLDATDDVPEIDWPRLVTACRKRLSAMLTAVAQHVQIIRPPLRHLDALIPMCAAMVSAPDFIAVLVGQRAFNGIGRPLSAFVEQSAGGTAETVGGHLILAIAHASQRRVQCVL